MQEESHEFAEDRIRAATQPIETLRARAQAAESALKEMKAEHERALKATRAESQQAIATVEREARAAVAAAANERTQALQAAQNEADRWKAKEACLRQDIRRLEEESRGLKDKAEQRLAAAVERARQETRLEEREAAAAHLAEERSKWVAEAVARKSSQEAADAIMRDEEARGNEAQIAASQARTSEAFAAKQRETVEALRDDMLIAAEERSAVALATARAEWDSARAAMLREHAERERALESEKSSALSERDTIRRAHEAEHVELEELRRAMKLDAAKQAELSDRLTKSDEWARRLETDLRDCREEISRTRRQLADAESDLQRARSEVGALRDEATLKCSAACPGSHISHVSATSFLNELDSQGASRELTSDSGMGRFQRHVAPQQTGCAADIDHANHYGLDDKTDGLDAQLKLAGTALRKLEADLHQEESRRRKAEAARVAAEAAARETLTATRRAEAALDAAREGEEAHRKSAMMAMEASAEARARIEALVRETADIEASRANAIAECDVLQSRLAEAVEAQLLTEARLKEAISAKVDAEEVRKRSDKGREVAEAAIATLRQQIEDEVALRAEWEKQATEAVSLQRAAEADAVAAAARASKAEALTEEARRALEHNEAGLNARLEARMEAHQAIRVAKQLQHDAEMQAARDTEARKVAEARATAAQARQRVAEEALEEMRLRLEHARLAEAREREEREQAVRQSEAATMRLSEIRSEHARVIDELQTSLARTQGALAGTEERLRSATRMQQLNEARHMTTQPEHVEEKSTSQLLSESQPALAPSTSPSASPAPRQVDRPGDSHVYSPVRQPLNPGLEEEPPAARSPLLDDVEEFAAYAKRERERFEKITSRHAAWMNRIAAQDVGNSLFGERVASGPPLVDVQTLQRRKQATV